MKEMRTGEKKEEDEENKLTGQERREQICGNERVHICIHEID